ncbi:MAG: DUF4276 family protein [Candidatus Aminicenantes bacterium]|nr:MAG: DUF4276 family protein [Candidatus Aminicenantes bacterium]
MIRVHVFVEGQTEETFVTELLQYHFLHMHIYLNPILIRTGKKGRGGVSTYGKIQWQIKKKCKEDKTAYVTTMLDVYGLPKDFPGKAAADKETSIQGKVRYLEDAFFKDIDQKHFIPNLLMHEFEALLFTAPYAFAEWFNEEAAGKLQEERQDFTTPEHIDDNPETAPSRRILRHCPGYQKPHHGILIALSIGLDNIRKECGHFNEWIEKIEKLQER